MTKPNDSEISMAEVMSAHNAVLIFYEPSAQPIIDAIDSEREGLRRGSKVSIQLERRRRELLDKHMPGAIVIEIELSQSMMERGLTDDWSKSYKNHNLK